MLRSHSQQNLFLSPTEFFEMGMDSVQVPYLEEDETNSKAGTTSTHSFNNAYSLQL